MDRRLFKAVYDFGVKSGTVGCAAVITKLSQPVFAVIFVSGGVLLYFERGLSAAAAYVFLAFAALAVNTCLRRLIGRERPFIHEDIKAYIMHEASGSFPSNHGVSTMVIAVLWAAVNIYCSALFVVLALVTGISRIFVGVHYPLDVFCGWLIGAVFGIMFFII